MINFEVYDLAFKRISKRRAARTAIASEPKKCLNLTGVCMSNEEKINKTELTSRFLENGYSIVQTMALVDIVFPPGPYEHFKKGDRVITGFSFNRYFSNVDGEGTPWVFKDGGDEWSSCGRTQWVESCTLWKEGD
jgi:hypothetical protein